MPLVSDRVGPYAYKARAEEYEYLELPAGMVDLMDSEARPKAEKARDKACAM